MGRICLSNKTSHRLAVTQYITLEMVRQIKSAIWSGGQSQDLIAEEFGCNQSTVSMISTGRMYATVPWPDESLGALNTERKIALRRVGRKSRISIGESSSMNTVVEEGKRAFHQSLVAKANTVDGPEPSGPAAVGVVSPNLMSDMDQLGARLEKEADEADEKAIRKPKLDKTKEAKTEVTTLSYDKLSLDFIKEVDNENPWLKEAEASDNEVMVEALCIVFKALDPGKWRGKQVGTMMGTIMKELEKHNA